MYACRQAALIVVLMWVYRCAVVNQLCSARGQWEPLARRYPAVLSNARMHARPGRVSWLGFMSAVSLVAPGRENPRAVAGIVDRERDPLQTLRSPLMEGRCGNEYIPFLIHTVVLSLCAAFVSLAICLSM